MCMTEVQLAGIFYKSKMLKKVTHNVVCEFCYMELHRIPSQVQSFSLSSLMTFLCVRNADTHNFKDDNTIYSVSKRLQNLISNLECFSKVALETIP